VGVSLCTGCIVISKEKAINFTHRSLRTQLNTRLSYMYDLTYLVRTCVAVNDIWNIVKMEKKEFNCKKPKNY